MQRSGFVEGMREEKGMYCWRHCLIKCLLSMDEESIRPRAMTVEFSLLSH